VKVALTEIGDVPTVNPQAAVPLHAPPQLVNVEPPPADCARVIFVPSSNEALHVPGHEMPAGVLVTVPEPVTETDTVT
jgi:hypothetical protein